MNNKTEIQARIEKCESDLASLKADLAKCDCAEGIEQEKCWHGINGCGHVATYAAATKTELASGHLIYNRHAYMPECRQVTAEDARQAHLVTMDKDEWLDCARELHKLGFRMKVNP